MNSSAPNSSRHSLRRAVSVFMSVVSVTAAVAVVPQNLAPDLRLDNIDDAAQLRKLYESGERTSRVSINLGRKPWKSFVYIAPDPHTVTLCFSMKSFMF